MVAEDHGLFDAKTAGNLDKIPRFLDCANQRMRQKAIVDQAVTKQL